MGGEERRYTSRIELIFQITRTVVEKSSYLLDLNLILDLWSSLIFTIENFTLTAKKKVPGVLGDFV